MVTTSARERAGRGRLPVAARDRRPALAALALLLILVGALGSALLVFRSGDRVTVLAARHDISFGERVTAADFTSVQVAADDVPLVRQKYVAELAGQRATGSIPQGALISPRMFTPKNLIPQGGQAVGIVVDATRRPSQMPHPGQVVRVYFVAGQNSSQQVPEDPVVVNAAQVLDVGRGSGAGTASVTVLVPNGLVAQVTGYASSGNLAIALLPDGTRPDVAAKFE